MTAWEGETIATLVRRLVGDRPAARTRIVIVVEPSEQASFNISVTPKTPKSRPERMIDPLTRRIVRQPGDPVCGPIDNPRWKGRRVGDPAPEWRDK